MSRNARHGSSYRRHSGPRDRRDGQGPPDRSRRRSSSPDRYRRRHRSRTPPRRRSRDRPHHHPNDTAYRRQQRNYSQYGGSRRPRDGGRRAVVARGSDGDGTRRANPPPPGLALQRDSSSPVLPWTVEQAARAVRIALHDDTRTKKRKWQLAKGKERPEYWAYVRLVHPSHRLPAEKFHAHPSTPPPLTSCSKRGYDGQVKAWRRALHQYDARVTPADTAMAEAFSAHWAGHESKGAGGEAGTSSRVREGAGRPDGASSTGQTAQERRSDQGKPSALGSLSPPARTVSLNDFVHSCLQGDVDEQLDFGFLEEFV